MFKISARAVLELGAELISSDIIAFYELIKNGFDAGTRKGVELRFVIPLRRRDYLEVLEAGRQSGPARVGLEALKSKLKSKLDATAGTTALQAFEGTLKSTTREEFIKALPVAFALGSKITVADTGSGMSLAELSRNFLVIGTPSRKHMVDAAVARGETQAPFLGEKGIGRLSAMRLGSRLTVETARAEDSRLNVLEIDWGQFDALDAMLEDIHLAPGPGGPKASSTWSGTTLHIMDLCEDWTSARVKALADYDFVRLTDPFLDPKERPRIAIFWNDERVQVPWMSPDLVSLAHAGFRGTYSIEDGEPVLRCTLEARDLGFKHPHQVDPVKLTGPDLHGAIIGTSGSIPTSALCSVGPFEFEAHWYNRRRLGSVDSIGDQRVVRELQRKYSGIMLFRDRYRVFPYGDDEDDWLALDRKALGRPGYSLNKQQFVGRVRITRMGNRHLVDQTNREGLRATPEQQVFVSVLQHVIQSLFREFLANVEKDFKAEPVDLGDVKGQVDELQKRVKRALTRIREATPKAERSTVDEVQQAFLEFQELVERAKRRIAEVEADGQQMVQLAGVGLMVEVVAHELARSSENALASLEVLRGSAQTLPADVRAQLDTLRAELKSVSKRLRVLDPLSVSGRQRVEPFDLEGLVEDIREGHAAQFRRHSIDLQVSSPVGRVRIKAVKGMIVQILENLISNSLYWMQIRATRESGHRCAIAISIEDNPPSIRFRDNGVGIALENRDKAFRPFWSLKEKAKRRGLGLYIARDCATYLGGTLALSEEPDPETGRLHEFVLELPDQLRVR